MTIPFLKIIVSDEVDDLILNHPNAFKLLYFIAKRARRVDTIDDGLKLGDAILGDYENMGLSRKEYRNALKFLKEHGFIETVYNVSTKISLRIQKRATRRATKSEVVNLCNTRIWDINTQNKGHVRGQVGATSGPQTRKKKIEEEEKEKVKKENSEISKEEKPKADPVEQLIAVRENIKLTPSQLQKLQEFHTKEKLDWLFDRLDSWMTTKDGPFTPRWCYGQLKPGGWPSNEYEKMKSEDVKTLSFSVNQKQIPSWQKQQDDARVYAHEVSKQYYSKYCDIEITQNAIFFHPKGGADTNPIEVKFKENGFKDQVNNLLRKKGFEPKIQSINENKDEAIAENS